MKIWHIVLYIFIFNLVISFVNTWAIGINYQLEGEDWAVQDPQTAYNVSSSASGSFGYQIGDFFASIRLFMTALLNATILLPVLLTNLGIVGGLNTILTVIVSLIYVIGLVQFIRGVLIE